MFGSAFQKQFLNRRSTLIVCVAVVLLLSSIARAERLPIKTYTVADGLLRDNVFKIKQDSRGFMWFCTVEGVSRFDGYAFTNFTTDDGLPDRHANDLLETKRGEIFVATDGGLARLNPTGVHGSRENPLFVVYPLDNPRAKSINVLAKAINVLFEDESGAIFIGTRDGLYKLSAGGELEAIYLGKSLNSVPEIDVVAIIKDRRGAVWIGTQNGGLFRLPPDGQVKQFTKANGLSGNIASLLEDRNGRIWVGARSGDVDDGLSLLVAERMEKEKPDVILTDLGLPGMSGTEGIIKIREIFPDIPIIALTIYDNDTEIFNALCNGASEMKISINTVSFHLKNIYEKLQVHSKTEAVAKALRENLI